MPLRLRRFIFGAPKDVKDPHAFHKLSLVALLAWVGLGADGLSSCAYGPDEAFRAARRAHRPRGRSSRSRWRCTVFIISYGYSRIIEQFPSGGGGYVVATQAPRPARRASSPARALLVDYVLTITDLDRGRRRRDLQLPARAAGARLKLARARVRRRSALLDACMNLRGVKESVTALVPIFVRLPGHARDR